MAVSPLWDPEVRPRTYRSYPARWVSQTAVSPKGQTKREQLYNQAKRLNVEGRSTMNKTQLQRAVAAKDADWGFSSVHAFARASEGYPVF